MGIRAGATERLGPVGGESLDMLGVEAVDHTPSNNSCSHTCPEISISLIDFGSHYRRPTTTIMNVPGLPEGRAPGFASSNSAVGR